MTTTTIFNQTTHKRNVEGNNKNAPVLFNLYGTLSIIAVPLNLKIFN